MKTTIVNISVCLLLAGCQTSEKGPEETAEKFVEALHTGNPEAAKLFISQNDPGLFLRGSETYTGPTAAAKQAVAEHGAIASISSKIQAEQGDNAVVEVTVVYKDGTKTAGPIPMQRTDSQWYFSPGQRN